MQLDRRTFCAAAALPGLANAADSWQFFTPAEASLVAALTDCIIPADQDPGALDAQVVRYIDRQLAGPLARFAPVYRKDLPAFAAACQAATSANFTDLSFEKRTAYLIETEKSKLAGFFAMVIDHTMQGFYGSPEHGGNRDAVSWKMLGIEKQMHEGQHHG